MRTVGRDKFNIIMAPTLTSFVNSFNNRLEAPVRQHLKNVYGCLSLTFLVAAAGAYVHFYTSLIRAGYLTHFGALGLVLALETTPDNGKNRQLRLGYLFGFAFLIGIGLGPLLEGVMSINPSLIVTSLVATTVVFVSFSIFSLLAERGRWLYLGGTLVSALNVMLLFAVANLFMRSAMIYQIHLYLGLVVMSGFIIYDTQHIVEKHAMGSRDFIGHSLDLFTDFIDVFRYLLILLTRKEEKENKRK